MTSKEQQTNVSHETDKLIKTERMPLNPLLYDMKSTPNTIKSIACIHIFLCSHYPLLQDPFSIQ